MQEPNLQWGGVSTKGTLTAEWYSQDFNLGAVHITSTWGIRGARGGENEEEKSAPALAPQPQK